MDYSASKDKEVALAFRGRRNVLEPIDEDAEMEDAASSPVDRKHDEGHSGESDHEKKEEGKADFSASKGKGRAPSPPNRSETEVSQGAGGTSNREAQDVNMEDHDDKEANQEDRDHEENSRERDPRDDRSTDGPGSLGRYTHCVQIPQVMPVNPPVQELRLREDGTWDIRPARRE